MNNLGAKGNVSGRAVPLLAGCLAAVLLSAGSLSAQQRRQVPPAGNAAVCGHLADQLLTATGYADSLKGATEISRIEFQLGLDSISHLTAADRKQIEEAFGRAFDPVRLRASIRAHMIQHCDQGTYNAVLYSLSSPLAQKMHQIEVQAGTAAGIVALRRYFDQISQHPPSAERMAVVKRLVASRHQLQFLERLLFVTAREIAVGFGNPPPSGANVRDAMRTYLPMADRMLLMRELGVYHDVPDRDLSRYAAMWESAPFQRFNRILTESSAAAFGSRVREAAQAVRPFLGKAPDGQKP